MERSTPSLCVRARGDLASWLLNPSLRYTQPWNLRIRKTQSCVYRGGRARQQPRYGAAAPCIMGSCDTRPPSPGRTGREMPSPVPTRAFPPEMRDSSETTSWDGCPRVESRGAQRPEDVGNRDRHGAALAAIAACRARLQGNVLHFLHHRADRPPIVLAQQLTQTNGAQVVPPSL